VESAETLVALTRAAWRAVESAFDLALAPLGLTAVDFEILQSLARGKRWSIVSLARSLRWERSALSYRVRRLEVRGLVLVDRRNQRRSRTSLSPEGVALFAAAECTFADAHQTIIAQLRSETAAVLAQLGELPVHVGRREASRCPL